MLRAASLALVAALAAWTVHPATLPPGLMAPEDAPRLAAASWIVYDDTAGVVLDASSEHEERPMASVTKLMTALVVVRHAALDDVVTVSARADGTGEASIGLVTGEQWTVFELLNAIMVRSANDAAVALAEHVGGSVEGFAVLMNETAAELEMINSHFVNPHGLDAEGHYSSAADLLTLVHTALREPVLARLMRTKVVTFRPDPDGTPRSAVNTNRLLGAYPGVIGVKTGYTSRAGRVLLAATDIGPRRIITVVMGSEDHFADTRLLLEFAAGTFGPWDRLVEGVVEEQGGGAGVAPPPLPDDVERRLRAMPELADGQGAASPTGATPGVQVIVEWLRAQIPAALGGMT
jgi:D-alanyl-D-alanine carboxypeptidase